MARKETVVSALHVLTSDEFLPSKFAYNSTLEALVAKYYGRNDDDIDDDESVLSEDEELRMFT